MSAPYDPNQPYQPYQPPPGYPPPYPQNRPPKGRRWPRRHPVLSVVLVALAGLFVAAGVAGSHQKTPGKASAAATAKASTAADARGGARSFASVRSLLAALDAGGARCRGADFLNSTVVGAAGNIADCSGSGSGDTVLAVFTSHSTAEAYATGIVALADEPDGTPAAVVVGPDWAVNTSPAFVGSVVKALGGTVVVGSPAPAAPTPAAPTTHAPAPGPKAVATFSGNGQENTPQFTVTSTWKLDYSYDCADDGGTGNFQVYEDGGSDFGGVSVNALGAGGDSSSWAYNDGGTHYLMINSECSWTVKVIDEP